MKLRLDLLEQLTEEDLAEEVLANNHRYKPEPNFSITGTGTLSSASTEERASEVARSMDLIRRLKTRAKKSWDENRQETLSLIGTLDLLRSYHRHAPFLFFNGNTFADVGRRLADALFADLPAIRRREVTSAVAHYIAGVLDRDSMIAAVDSLCRSADLQPGTRVETLRGSARGVVLRVLEDGRIIWKPDHSGAELTSLPEALRATAD